MPASPEASDVSAPPAPAAGTDDHLSALTGLIARALESADELAASTRKRKGTKVATVDPAPTDPAPE